MAILETDVKLMASERLTDFEDGGGQMSAVEVTDGVVNNLFPDISRLDRTYGRVSLRKTYPAVRTNNTDVYYGSHAIITDAPDDPRVSVIMFTTDDYQDERIAARDRIERYVVQGPESYMVLYGAQLIGQRTVMTYQRPEEPIPEVGQVYLLSEESNGVVTQEQYVRVTELTDEVRTFTDDQGDFQKRVITLEISSPLLYTFEGVQTPKRKSNHGSPTLVRSTTVADAAKYYGIVKLAQDITAGDMSIKAETIYGQLVPSTQAESPVIDIIAGGELITPVTSAGAEVVLSDVTYGGDIPSIPSLQLPCGVTPGSLRIQCALSSHWPNLNNWGLYYGDDGTGNIIVTKPSGAGGPSLNAIVGEIDYATGLLLFTTPPSTPNISGSGDRLAIWAVPATGVSDTAHTDAEEITLANRGYNYIRNLRPIPAPGTLVVDYMVLGKWYRMKDDGSGELFDEVGGVGTIDYQTGSVVATLGALPDTGSKVLYSWGTKKHYEPRTGDANILPPAITHTTVDPVRPGTLTISWFSGGAPKTATDDGAGNITGDGQGRLMRVHESGTGTRTMIWLMPTTVPDSGSQITFDFETGNPQSETPTASMAGDTATFTLSGGPIKAGSVSIEWDTTFTYS